MFGIFNRAAKAEEAATYFEKKWMESQLQVLQLRAKLADKRLDSEIKRLEKDNLSLGDEPDVALSRAQWSMADSEEEKSSEEAWAAYSALQSDYETRYR